MFQLDGSRKSVVRGLWNFAPESLRKAILAEQGCVRSIGTSRYCKANTFSGKLPLGLKSSDCFSRHPQKRRSEALGDLIRVILFFVNARDRGFLLDIKNMNRKVTYETPFDGFADPHG